VDTLKHKTKQISADSGLKR